MPPRNRENTGREWGKENISCLSGFAGLCICQCFDILWMVYIVNNSELGSPPFLRDVWLVVTTTDVDYSWETSCATPSPLSILLLTDFSEHLSQSLLIYSVCILQKLIVGSRLVLVHLYKNLKGPQNENFVIICSLQCCYKPIWCSVFFFFFFKQFYYTTRELWFSM